MLNNLYHMLDPVAISAGPITIYWYGLAYVVSAHGGRYVPHAASLGLRHYD